MASGPGNVNGTPRSDPDPGQQPDASRPQYAQQQSGGDQCQQGQTYPEGFDVVDEDVCDDIAEEGDRYVTLAGWTGGFTEHICTHNWGVTFEGMAEDIVGRTMVFELSQEPVGDSIQVYYVYAPGNEEEQAQGVVWEYDASTNSIRLLDGHTPPDGTAIEVRYQVEV